MNEYTENCSEQIERLRQAQDSADAALDGTKINLSLIVAFSDSSYNINAVDLSEIVKYYTEKEKLYEESKNF